MDSFPSSTFPYPQKIKWSPPFKEKYLFFVRWSYFLTNQRNICIVLYFLYSGSLADVAILATADLSHLPTRFAQCRRDGLADCVGHHPVDPGRNDHRFDDARLIDADQWRHCSRPSDADFSNRRPNKIRRRRRGENDDSISVQAAGSARMQRPPVSDHCRPEHLPLVVPDGRRRRFHDGIPRLDADRFRRPLVHCAPLARPSGFRIGIAFRLQHGASVSSRLPLPASPGCLPVGLRLAAEVPAETLRMERQSQGCQSGCCCSGRRILAGCGRFGRWTTIGGRRSLLRHQRSGERRHAVALVPFRSAFRPGSTCGPSDNTSHVHGCSDTGRPLCRGFNPRPGWRIRIFVLHFDLQPDHHFVWFHHFFIHFSWHIIFIRRYD